MQEALNIGMMLACVAALVVGCGRRSPDAPPSTGASIPSVQAISIRGGAVGASLAVGQSVQLKATARLSDGSEYDITILAAWYADDTRVATVASTGLVTAQGSGTGRIRAAYQQAIGVASFQVADRPASLSGPSSPDFGTGRSRLRRHASSPRFAVSRPGPGVPPALPPAVQSQMIVSRLFRRHDTRAIDAARKTPGYPNIAGRRFTGGQRWR